jgi:hypothetical protein
MDGDGTGQPQKSCSFEHIALIQAQHAEPPRLDLAFNLADGSADAVGVTLGEDDARHQRPTAETGTSEQHSPPSAELSEGYDYFSEVKEADDGSNRTPPSVSRTVDWGKVHAGTRTRATPTSFGWPVKLGLSGPPLIWFLYVCSTGLFSSPLTAMAWGAPMLAGVIWWGTKIWNKGRRQGTPRV